MIFSDIPGEYLEYGAVLRLSEQLCALENEVDYKLSKSIAYSLFILNIIAQKSKAKYGHDDLRQRLHVPISVVQRDRYFQNFDFKERAVTFHDCIEWIRNRLSHFDEPAPRGIHVEARSDGIRRFTIKGRISNHRSYGGIELVATMDRRRLTHFIKDVSNIYLDWAVDTGRVIENGAEFAAVQQADGAA